MVLTSEVQVGTRWERIHNRQIVRVVSLNPNGTATVEWETWEKRRESFFPSFIVSAFNRLNDAREVLLAVPPSVLRV